ncbi:MAG: DUF1573 domain-containing protein [Planctomycetes bacterium]|nr:DUF1573 domain-containing protein [Planctomycetota bacterium]
MAKKKPIIILSAVVLVSIVLVRAIWFTSVLVGEKTHDFGFIEVTPPKTVVNHTFTLTNKSGRDLVLVDVVPDCGCTTTEAYQELVLDGEELVLPVQLKLRQSQLRKSSIRLVFEDGTIEILTLSAVGRLKDSLRISTYPIVIKPNGHDSMATIGLEQFDNSKPPLPEFTLPDGVTISTQRWKIKNKYDARQQTPANWSMQLSFATEKEIEDASELVVTVGDHTLRVPIVSEAKAPIELPYTEFPLP